MPAPKGRGGARGGGIAGGGRFESLSQGSVEVQEEENQFMRDREHAEKRKREGPQGGAEGSPPRRDNRFTNDSDATSAEATPRKKPSPSATRMTTRSSEKNGAQRDDVIELSPSRGSQAPSVQDRDNTQGAPTIGDVMRHLLRMEEKEREDRARAREERARAVEKENEYKNEIKQLQSTVTALALDLKSLQESVPNWGSLQSSLMTGTTADSYAGVVARGVPLSEPERATTPFRTPASHVSFGPSKQSDGSPIRSPPTSVGQSISSAMKKTAHTQEADMIIDLSKLDMEGHQGHDQVGRTKSRIIAAIRSNERLETVELKRFMIRHTNNDVHLAYFRIGKEAEEIARRHAGEWIDEFLKGAKLVESRWYPIKIDFIPTFAADENNRRKISKEAMDAFSRENDVDVKQMNWLGEPKPRASHASAVAKLATKEQVERLLALQRDGTEIKLFECMVEVSVFFEKNGPRACYQCQQFGHIKRDCKNQPKCARCAQLGHENCETGTIRCANCQGNHMATDKSCPVYRKQQERSINLRFHE
jgi:hypothetical protein